MTKNLIYIIENYRLSSGLVSTNFDQQLLQFAINGFRKLRDLGLVKDVVKAVELTVVNQKANLPQDFKELIRMGVCKCGTMVQYVMNDDLCLPNSNTQTCPCTDSDIDTCISENNGNDLNSWIFPVYGQPYSYSYTAGSYAIGPGNYHGGYRIDYANQQIILDVNVDSIILEYYGDILNDAGNALIPESFIECLTLWLDYERKYWSMDAQLRREAPAARVRWYSIVRQINAQNNAMNKHNWTSLFRSYCYQGTKS